MRSPRKIERKEKECRFGSSSRRGERGACSSRARRRSKRGVGLNGNSGEAADRLEARREDVGASGPAIFGALSQLEERKRDASPNVSRISGRRRPFDGNKADRPTVRGCAPGIRRVVRDVLYVSRS